MSDKEPRLTITLGLYLRNLPDDFLGMTQGTYTWGKDEGEPPPPDKVMTDILMIVLQWHARIYSSKVTIEAWERFKQMVDRIMIYPNDEEKADD